MYYVGGMQAYMQAEVKLLILILYRSMMCVPGSAGLTFMHYGSDRFEFDAGMVGGWVDWGGGSDRYYYVVGASMVVDELFG